MKISLVLALIFIISNQPMFMIGVLMMLVFLFSYLIYMELSSFWFGYILMLVLLSGVLVVFSYVISLIPNEGFEFFSMLVFLIVFLFMFNQIYIATLKMDDSFMCLLLWEGIMLGYTIYLVLFLLVVMIMVIFVSFPQKGALRLLLCAWLKD